MTGYAMPEQLGLLVLQTCRIGGLIGVSPLPWREAPMRVRAALVLVLAFVAYGAQVPSQDPVSPFSLLLAVPTEVLVGVAMGMVVRIAFSAADVAADSVGFLFGLAIPSVFDPQTLTSETVLARIFSLMMALLAVLVGVHRALVGAVLASFRVMPAGSVADPALATVPLLKMVAAAMTAGLRLALPILSVLLITQIALAFLSRAAPAMQIFSVGFAVSLAVGTTILIVALPDLASQMAADLSSIGGRIEGLVAAWTGQ